MISALRALVPEPILSLYHRLLSWFAAVWYRHPSEELIVIGVTGTTGKTTTCYLIAKALEASGYQTGCTTTALFKIGEREWLNATKMTMLGRFQLQKLLREMVTAGCRYAVVETSSQGIVQHRHAAINYDVVVFTNLTPEHIEAHGGFEKYKAAKITLFTYTASCLRKTIDGERIAKISVLNADDQYARDFAVPGFDQTFFFELSAALDLEIGSGKTHFFVDNIPFTLRLPGAVNIQNALAAITVCKSLKMYLPAVSEKLFSITNMPGRYEWINGGQSWKVLVDYAHEPEAMTRLYEAMKAVPHQKIIHVIGSAGGGRDVARRPVLGRLAGENADVVIVTNEDPYDDDPRTIIDQVAEGVRQAGKKDGESLLIIEDRKQAISEAMRRAQPGDLVLLTGKGSEQAICLANGKKMRWDEREVAREAIRIILNSEKST